MSDKTTITINFTDDQELHRNFKVLCAQRGVHMTALIKDFMKKEIEKSKEEK